MYLRDNCLKYLDNFIIRALLLESVMFETDNAAAAWLAEHPRMTGVLFTMMLLLSQAGSVAAGGSAVGP